MRQSLSLASSTTESVVESAIAKVHIIIIDLLCDIPQVSRGVESHEAVVYRHLVEVGAFFVPEERVRNPDLVPAVLAQPHLRYLIVDGIEDESRISP